MNSHIQDDLDIRIPKSREEYLSLFRKYYKLISDGLSQNYSNTGPVWFSPERTILTQILTDFIDQQNPLNNPEDIDHRIKAVNKLFRNNPTTWDFIYFLNKEIPGLDLNLSNIPKKIPGFDQIINNELIPKDHWYYDGEFIKYCFIMWKIFQIPEQRDDVSLKFANEFENYILNTLVTKDNKKLNSVTELRNYYTNGKNVQERPGIYVTFFRKLFEEISCFYIMWYAAKDLPVDEYMLMNTLIDEEFPDNTRINVHGTLICAELLSSNRKSPYHKCRVESYLVYIMTGTGKVFGTIITIPVEPKNKGEKKRKVFSQEDLRYKPLGTKISLSGKIVKRYRHPINIYWRDKTYTFEPCELKNTRILSIE